MSETPVKVVIDAKAKTTKYIPLSAEEIAQREADAAQSAIEQAQREAEEQAKADAKASALAKLEALGLTEDEALAIVGG